MTLTSSASNRATTGTEVNSYQVVFGYNSDS